jgi:catechol 2,3-dioxygenase-like lactoylglutathione lyase family enzyme
MQNEIERMLDVYESGKLTRRELAMGIAFLVATLTGAGRTFAAEQKNSAAENERGSTFEATGLDHIALRVTDVAKSREFYIRHLGLKPSWGGGDTSFLTFGNSFLALFEGSKPGLDHYCYTIKDYDVAQAEKKLREAGLKNIRRTSGRIYFDDPDGLTVQLAAE